jgi:hypothetical protein
MKKIIGVLIVLLLCCILVIPACAEEPTMTVSPGGVNNLGNIAEFIITFSPYTPGWVGIVDVHMWWDLYVYSTEPYFM